MLGLTAGAAIGRFELQFCAQCGAMQYPPREACHRCLSDRLVWRPQSGDGELISETISRIGQELFFRERAPWRLGWSGSPIGPTVVAHLHAACPPAPTAVRIEASSIAPVRPRSSPCRTTRTPSNDDPKLRDMTCDPKNRKMLVTDGKSAVGQAMVAALADAGAELVWAGNAEPWKKPPGFADCPTLPKVTLVPLDVTDTRSVSELAAEIGGKVDIVINTADHHRTFGICGAAGVETAQAEMDINYFGLLRLAQAFGPVMRGARRRRRQQCGGLGQPAVDLRAVEFSAARHLFGVDGGGAVARAMPARRDAPSPASASSMSFPGPIDDEWNQLLLPPKLAPAALASAMSAR